MGLRRKEACSAKRQYVNLFSLILFFVSLLRPHAANNLLKIF